MTLITTLIGFSPRRCPMLYMCMTFVTSSLTTCSSRQETLSKCHHTVSPAHVAGGGYVTPANGMSHCPLLTDSYHSTLSSSHSSSSPYPHSCPSSPPLYHLPPPTLIFSLPPPPSSLLSLPSSPSPFPSPSLFVCACVCSG